MKSKTIKKCAAKKAVAQKCTKKCVTRKTVAQKPAKKNVTFTFHADKGKAVYLAGVFNQWSLTAKKMTYKARSGIYAATVRLAPGSYEYKFVVDGVWCADPENTNSVANDQGTFNSVIEVK